MLELARESTTPKCESIYQHLNGTLSKRYHCVEMKPAKELPIYQFKLYRVPDNQGAVLFVKPDSKIMDYLKTNTVLDMKYLPVDHDSRFRLLPTQIRGISKENNGPFRGHYKVDISIAEER